LVLQGGWLEFRWGTSATGLATELPVAVIVSNLAAVAPRQNADLSAESARDAGTPGV